MSEPQRQVSAANPNMTGNPTKDEQFSANPLLEEYFSSTLIIWGVLCENFEIDKRMDLESKKIMDLLFVEVSMWSVTNSIALASTVKIEEYFDRQHIWTTTSVTADAATLSSSLAPPVIILW